MSFVRFKTIILVAIHCVHIGCYETSAHRTKGALWRLSQQVWKVIYEDFKQISLLRLAAIQLARKNDMQ